MDVVCYSKNNTRDEDGSDDVDVEDHLQKELEFVDPIPNVRRQAYVLIVGDSGTGKSTLAWSFTRFPRTAAKRYHRIDINSDRSKTRKKGKNSIGLHFFCVPFRDTDGDCIFKRPLEHPSYNLIIYLFDVNRRITFKNTSKWHRVMTWYLGNNRLPPSILVGNKIDLRPLEYEINNCDSTVIWEHDGKIKADMLGATRYVEVCALAELNTRNLLVQILRMLNITWDPDF